LSNTETRALELLSSLGDPRAMARELAARHAFWLFATVLAVAAVINAWVNWRQPWPLALPALGYGLSAALCAWASRMRGARADRALLYAGVAGVLLAAFTAWIYGWGLNGPSMGFYAIVTLAFAAFFSARAGVAMAVHRRRGHPRLGRAARLDLRRGGADRDADAEAADHAGAARPHRTGHRIADRAIDRPLAGGRA
jgi:hypothetical protein